MHGAAAGAPPLLGAAVGNGPGTFPPTPAMKRFADSLARQKAERDVLLAVQQGAAPAPAAMLLNIKGIGPEFAAILWSEGLFRHFVGAAEPRSRPST